MSIQSDVQSVQIRFESEKEAGKGEEKPRNEQAKPEFDPNASLNGVKLICIFKN